MERSTADFGRRMRSAILLSLAALLASVLTLMSSAPSVWAADQVPEGMQCEVKNGEVIIRAYGGDLTELVVPDAIGGYPVTSIGYDAFRSESLERVILPDSITSIGAKAFSHCDSLEEVVLSASLTEIPDSCFYYCTSLKNIIIPENVGAVRPEWICANS